MNKILIIVLLAFYSFQVSSQNASESGKSNIQEYTPSKLLNNGQWDIKFFNNLYTETKKADSSGDITENLARETYFTSTIDIFTGVSKSSKLNLGLLIEMRSNVIGDRKAFDVFKFDDDVNSARSGITSFAPAVKFRPLKNINNFTIQSAFHIPLVDNESENGVYLDQTAYTFQNRFFYDYTFPNNDWQLFAELNTEYNFGDESSYANKTYVIAPGLFLSYFPSQKSTLLGFVQHSQRFGDFTQDFTALGLGGKYQLNQTLNLEVLYSSFIRGKYSGIGQSFNLGLRALL